MRNPTHISGKEIDLTKLTFSAKVDYLTIRTVAKTKLPQLSGKPKWPREHHGNRLTVHDPSQSDLVALVDHFGPAWLVEVEIAVDVRPRSAVPPDQREALLQAVMLDVFARRLEPSAGAELSTEFRAFYRQLDKGYIVRPFNKGLPRATDQQLHGGRNDPAQVKAYLKCRDNRIDLPPEKQVARVEVRLSGMGLLAHDLETLVDLGSFPFRRRLLPYFRHMRGTRRLLDWKNGSPPQMLLLLMAKQEEIDDEHWDQVGVGPFLRGGKRERGKVRFMRDTAVNNRIGQALMRLERQFGLLKFVRLGDQANGGSPAMARLPARTEVGSITN